MAFVNLTGRQLKADLFVPSDGAILGYYPIRGWEFSVTDVRYPYGHASRFGCDLTGVTLSTDQFKNLVKSTLVNGTVFVPPGSTLLFDAAVSPLAGQTWVMDGVVIKRANGLTDTTATAITTSGQQIIAVANPSQWRVGADVTVFNGATVEYSNHPILAKNGNLLTLGFTFGQAFPSGGTVVSSHEQVACINVPRVTIRGGEWDGNSANNLTLRTWQNHSSFHFVSDKSVLTRLYVHDAQSDGIQWGGDRIQLSESIVQNSQGNGVHLSGAHRVTVSDVIIDGANLSGTVTGHADGCFIFSAGVTKGTVTNLVCIGGIASIGSIDADDNTDFTFTGIYAEGASSYFLDMVVPDIGAGRIVVANFIAHDCGSVAINETTNAGHYPATAGAYHVQLAQGQLFNTTIVLVRARNVTMDGVTVDLTGNTTLTGISVTQCRDITISDSVTVIGGNVGIAVGGVCENIHVGAATLRDQYAVGLALTPSTGSRNVQAVGTRLTNSSATVTGVSTASSATYWGINLANGTVARGCQLDLQVGQYGVLLPNGGTNVTGGIATLNRVITPAGMPSFKIFGGAQNNYVRNNWYAVAIANGQPVGNVVEGNMILGAAAAIDAASVAPTYRFPLYGWQQLTTVAANQTDVPLTDLMMPLGRQMAEAGSVVGLGLELTTAPTGFSATVKVQLSTDNGVTWTTIAGCSITTSTATGSSVGFTAGTYTYAKRDRLRLTVTTTSAWAPTANDLYAWMEVTQ